VPWQAKLVVDMLDDVIRAERIVMASTGLGSICAQAGYVSEVFVSGFTLRLGAHFSVSTSFVPISVSIDFDEICFDYTYIIK